jgi:hypothetical protein
MKATIWMGGTAAGGILDENEYQDENSYRT